jgi:PAS domain S-box-containing protein
MALPLHSRSRQKLACARETEWRWLILVDVGSFRVGPRPARFTAASVGDQAVPDRASKLAGLPERQNVEMELHRLAAIVASSSDAIISTSLDGIIATWNRAAEAIFGYRPEEVLGQPVSVLAAPGREDEMPLMLDRIKRGDRIEHYETVRRGREGLEVAVSLTVSPIRDASGWIVGASKIARDITERKRAEAELLHLTETLERRVAERTAELEQANQRLRAEIAEREHMDARLRELESELFHAGRLSAVGHMAGALAHELNQPLAAAANFVNAARRLLASGKSARIDTVPGVLEEAAGEVMRAGQIIRRLRDFVRHGETERQPESVVAIIEESSALALTGAGAAGIRARFRFDPKATRGLANRIEIQQVLVNLTRNALEAMAESAQREIEVSTILLDDETIEIAVADSGPGLAKEVALHLFEPFVSTKRHGMGLGLSICRSIVQAHGGRLHYQPNPGGGTIFRFTLPAVPRRDHDDGE